MHFQKFMIAAVGAAILAVASAGSASAQFGNNAAPAPAAPSAAPSAPSGPMNAGPAHVAPAPGFNNRSNLSARRPSGTTAYNRGNRRYGHHWRGYRNGYAFAPFGWFGPDYYNDYAYEYGPDCVLQRRVFRTRSGHRYIRWVRVCD